MPALDEYYARKFKQLLANLPQGATLSYNNGWLFVNDDPDRDGIHIGNFLWDFGDTTDFWSPVLNALNALYDHKSEDAEKYLLGAIGWKGTKEEWYQHTKLLREEKEKTP